MFVSTTEPAPFHSMGVVSNLPEEYGADFLWDSALGLVGVQRKEFPNDFLASMFDNRLNEQFQKMRQLDVAILMLEGPIQWTTEGELYGRGPRNRQYSQHRDVGWSRTQHNNYLASVQMRGVQVHYTESIAGTIECINGLRVWSDKREHNSLDHRAAPKSATWYDLSSAEFFTWFYQGIIPSGIGPKTARAIYDKLGLIFRITVGPAELEQVAGIGKKKAKLIVDTWSGEQ